MLAKSSVPFRKAVRSRIVRVGSTSYPRVERETRPGGGLAHQRVEGGEIRFDQGEERTFLARPHHEQGAGTQPRIIALDELLQRVLVAARADPETRLGQAQALGIAALVEQRQDQRAVLARELVLEVLDGVAEPPGL